MEAGFSVRQAVSSDELWSVFVHFSIKEGWRIGKYDGNFLFDVDPTGFFIGELNGKPISCVSVVKYGENFAFLGFYVVHRDDRGRGFGLKTFQTALSSLDGKYCCGLCCSPDMIPMYQKSGFMLSKSRIIKYFVAPSYALKALSYTGILPVSNITIKPVYEVNFEDVAKYDSYVFGAPHQKYLQGLLSTPEQYGFVAVNGKADIVGLIVVEKAILDDGWIIAPLFANNLQIAKSLLVMVFETVYQISDEKVSLNMEVGLNPHCNELAATLKCTPSSVNFVTMYNKDLSETTVKKEFIFVVVSAALG